MDDNDDAGAIGGRGDEEDLKRQETSFLQACRKQFAIPLEHIFRDFHEISKIGEGVVGEVFEGTLKESVGSGSPRNGGPGGDTEGEGSSHHHEQSLVFKVVPLQGSLEVNGERQKRFEEMEPEVRITTALSSLASPTEGSGYSCPGFATLLTAFLACGKYPAKLVSAWETWDEEYESDNESPELFDDSQRYMVLLFQNGGEDAILYKYYDARQAFSVVMQVIHSLAVAEAALEFEHRDLHVHNILVSSTPKEAMTYRFNGGAEVAVPSFGVSAVMIDFAWSRIRAPSEPSPIVHPMSQDPEMFMSSGKYQYDIYRRMRDLNRDDWTTYMPKTNVLWIHYLCDRMLHGESFTSGGTLQHFFYMMLIDQIKHKVQTFPSCQAFVSSPLAVKLLTTAPMITRNLGSDGSFYASDSENNGGASSSSSGGQVPINNTCNLA